ncbi:MAG: nitroreductase family deazaflavin-dependent oxidoreductase [Halieaceae bacterium]|nr:nitroreductase family deazaflavin-dependent oxidoreductase [Halieaceae bacterium]
MSASHYFYRFFLNPLMRGILRSPLHGITSHNICILHFRGRKSGRALSTPLSYTREGDLVRLLSNQNTRWWINFRGNAAPVEIELAGQRHTGIATLIEGDTEQLRQGVRRFIRALPRDAKVYGLKLDKNRAVIEESLTQVANELVVVEIQLETGS